MKRTQRNSASDTNYMQGVDTLRMVTSPVEYALPGVGTSNGYYYIEYSDQKGTSANIRYIDYASHLDIPLSAQITSDHTDSTSESYLESTVGGCTLFSIDNKLYFLRCGSPIYYDTYGEDALPAIYSMSLDGSGRKELFVGQSSEEFKTTIACDDNYLYLVRSCPQLDEMGNGGITSTEQLVSISLKSGDLSVLCDIPVGSHIIGANSNKIIFERFYNNTHANTQEIRGEIFYYSTNDAQNVVLDSWVVDDNLSYRFIQEDNLITVNLSDRIMKIAPIEESGSNELQQTISMDEIFSDDETHLWSPSFYDEYFFCEDSTKPYMWAVNLMTGEKKLLTLTYYNDSKKQLQPIKICAENDEMYLIVTNETLSAGMSMPTLSYALISKDNYLASIAIFDSIEKVE